MAKILRKTHKPKVLGADTHSVSLKINLIPLNELEQHILSFSDFECFKLLTLLFSAYTVFQQGELYILLYTSVIC